MRTMINDRRIQKGEKTRENILSAAIEIIAENGLKDISAAKLAKASGISKSTIFHHFKSNELLMISALNYIFEELLQSMKIGKYRDVEHFLDTLGQTMIQASENKLTLIKAFLSFFHEGIFNLTYREILVSYAEQMNEIFRTQLLELAPKSVNHETINAISRLILPMIDGIGFHYLLNKDIEKYQQAWKLQTKGILYLLSV